MTERKGRTGAFLESSASAEGCWRVRSFAGARLRDERNRHERKPSRGSPARARSSRDLSSASRRSRRWPTVTSHDAEFCSSSPVGPLRATAFDMIEPSAVDRRAPAARCAVSWSSCSSSLCGRKWRAWSGTSTSSATRARAFAGSPSRRTRTSCGSPRASRALHAGGGQALRADAALRGDGVGGRRRVGGRVTLAFDGSSSRSPR